MKTAGCRTCNAELVGSKYRGKSFLRYRLSHSVLTVLLCLSLSSIGTAPALAKDQSLDVGRMCERSQPSDLKNGKSQRSTPTAVSEHTVAQVCIYNSAGHGELLLSKSLSYASKFIEAVNQSKPVSRKSLKTTSCSASIGPTMFIYFTFDASDAVEMTLGGCPWLVSSTSALKFWPAASLKKWKTTYFGLAAKKD